MRRWRTLVTCLILGCAGPLRYRPPASLEGYDFVVPGNDTLSMALVEALRSRGMRVQRNVRGGGRPAVAVVWFAFREPGAGFPTWLHVRLADTRTGGVVGEASLEVQPLPSGAGGWAQVILDSLGLGRRRAGGAAEAPP